MITMMLGFDPAGLETESAEATVALAMIAAVIRKTGNNCFFMSVRLPAIGLLSFLSIFDRS